MKRRALLKSAATLAPLVATFSPLSAANHGILQRLAVLADATDRVLVLIQLNGGNDGLSSFVPLANYGLLSQKRGNILIPEKELIKPSNCSEFGLHPALRGLSTLYEKELLTVVHGVGYPNSDLSHFKGINIKLTAHTGDRPIRSGWIGRYLDHWRLHSDNHAHGPQCLRIGEVSPMISHGEQADVGIGIRDLEGLNFNGPDLLGDRVSDTMAGSTISTIREVTRQLKLFAPIILAAAEKQPNLSHLYPDNGDEQRYVRNDITGQLRTVARLIGGGLGSRVYVVNQNGYDTHANQVDRTDTTKGLHAELLGNLSAAITAFQDDLRLMGWQDRVLGMTFSEFGRRISSSNSLGTDHGTADTMMFFGTGLQHRMLGTESVTSIGSDDENLPIAYDFRAVYASVLEQWFTLDSATTNKLIPGTPESRLPLLS